MPINQLNITFTVAQDTAINGAATTINTNFPFAVNLNEAERASMKGIDNERYPYIQRTMDIYVPNNTNLVTGFAGSVSDAQNDWALIKQIDGFIIKFEQIIEKFSDTRRLASHELFTFFLHFYNTVGEAKDNNVPGADVIYNDLKTLFAGQGGSPTTPPPAPPVV